MSADGLTEEDELALELASDDATAPSETDDVDELRDLIYEFADELNRTKQDYKEFKQTTNQRLHAIEQSLSDDVNVVGASKLRQYQSMPEEIRQETLEVEEHRAVLLYEHWDDISWQTFDQSTYCVDTKAKANQKNNPSLLKLNLDRIYDDSLEWSQIYRVMERVALLSGGEKTVDEYGRVKIEGGEFVYEQLPTADNSGMKRVLREAVDDE